MRASFKGVPEHNGLRGGALKLAGAGLKWPHAKQFNVRDRASLKKLAPKGPREPEEKPRDGRVGCNPPHCNYLGA